LLRFRQLCVAIYITALTTIYGDPMSDIEKFLAMRARAQRKMWEMVLEEAASRGLLEAVAPLARRILQGRS